MSAGRGIQHSEFNNSKTELVHLLQIWIEPAVRGVEPSYEQRPVVDLPLGKLVPVVSGDGREGTMKINQDAVLSLSRLEATNTLEASLNSKRYYWLHVATGAIESEGTVFKAGDALAISGETTLSLHAQNDSQLLLFDLA